MKKSDKAKRGTRKSAAKPPARVAARRRSKEKLVRAEAAFQRNERRLKALFEQTTDLVAVIDREGTCRYASPSFGPMLGYTPEELIGKDLFFMVHPDDLTDARRAVAIRVESGGAASNPAYVRIRHADGSWRLQEAIGNNLLDDPAVQGIVISSRDITHRRRVEMALSKSEEHYHTLFSAIDEGFCVIEVIFDENEKPIDYRFLEINPSFEKQMGLVDALGKRMRELVPKHEEYWFETLWENRLNGRTDSLCKVGRAVAPLVRCLRLPDRPTGKPASCRSV